MGLLDRYPYVAFINEDEENASRDYALYYEPDVGKNRNSNQNNKHGVYRTMKGRAQGSDPPQYNYLPVPKRVSEPAKTSMVNISNGQRENKAPILKKGTTFSLVKKISGLKNKTENLKLKLTNSSKSVKNKSSRKKESSVPSKRGVKDHVIIDMTTSGSEDKLNKFLEAECKPLIGEHLAPTYSQHDTSGKKKKKRRHSKG